MKAFAVAISCLLLASPGLAQATEGNTTNGQEPTTTASNQQSRSDDTEEGEGGERRICRRVGDRTASLTAGRRVCMTAEQWRNARARD
ncbi:MAG TPA: hypothetical protein VF704_10110 [Allosphingosinicella sp.]|jgi:hypothetical protein